uniref:Fibrinogen C-terminal domain-containing protein n=1 Tax=Clytia hemisphaerica TaxID=252671 RepID=A0A7M5V3K0_9CNID
MKSLIILVLTAILPNLLKASTTTDDISLLKSQVKALSKQIAETNQKLAHVTQENRYLTMKDQVQNGVCHFSTNPCEPCFCVEDYSMVEKYYCDCRAQPIRRDCKEHYDQGERISGLYVINKNAYSLAVQVYCDHVTDGGGWTVFQRRVDGSENFYRNWTEYEIGFGRLNREFWLGNENLYRLTAQAFMKGSEVRFDMQKRGSSSLTWAKYSNFELTSKSTGYELHISGYSGNAGDHMTYHNGAKFSTYDRDLDNQPSVDCATRHRGAFWYKSCHWVNINGYYDEFKEFHVNDGFAPSV